ncbi:hypothetical protein GCM10020001_015030 [Nonomuraea salmonea]
MHAGDGGEQRGAHDPARAGPLALVERGGHAVRAVDAGQQVRDGRAHAVGLVGRRAGQRHQAGLALGDLVVARAAALGAVVAEAGDRQDDQAGVELVQPLDGEAEAVEYAGAEVLDQDVAVADEPFDELFLPSSDFRSTAMDCLLRLAARKYVDMS